MMKYLKYLGVFLFVLSNGYCSENEAICPGTYETPKRLLLLDGDDGTVACRIYGGLLSGTIPRFSDNGTIESATRTLLRMNNLTAVRGVPGASMVGPVDYFGNLENPHQYLFTIKNEFPPLFYRQPIPDGNQESLELKDFDPNLITVIKANWVCGKDYQHINEKNIDYGITKRHLRQSLFKDPGLLEVDRERIDLRWFDPRDVDLSSFKVRLVNNQVPFRITTKELPSKDEYRLVSYLYESHYADWQFEKGSGHFLEQHKFSQTMTPITPDSAGFIVLARTNEIPDELELIGVQIPFGYTLVVEDGAIHGDTAFNGLFMMGMTSDHKTMETADTVFLKYPETKGNVQIEMIGKEETIGVNEFISVPPPYVIYRCSTERDEEEFRRLTSGQSFIFNPFSRQYWR